MLFSTQNITCEVAYIWLVSNRLRLKNDSAGSHIKEEGKLKVARYSFSRSIPPKFERKLRRHKQGFGKIDTTVVLDKEENWL